MPGVKRYLQGSTRLDRSYERALKRRKMNAASTIQRVYRSRMNMKRPMSYVTRARNATGEDNYSYPALASTVKSDGYVARASNDLIELNIINIPRKTTTEQDLDTRETDVIYLSGFKVNFTVKNNLANDNTNQLYFNLALISLKSGVSTFTGADLFTSGGGTTRNYDFDNVNYSTLERHQDPINSDKYVVHFHRRMLISPNQQAAVGFPSGSWPYVVPLSFYVPIKRQIRFDASSGTSNVPQFRLIWWCGSVGEGYSDPIVQTADAIKTEHSVTCFYREPPR